VVRPAMSSVVTLVPFSLSLNSLSICRSFSGLSPLYSPQKI
jgi:hypothetical protein